MKLELSRVQNRRMRQSGHKDKKGENELGSSK